MVQATCVIDWLLALADWDPVIHCDLPLSEVRKPKPVSNDTIPYNDLRNKTTSELRPLLGGLKCELPLYQTTRIRPSGGERSDSQIFVLGNMKGGRYTPWTEHFQKTSTNITGPWYTLIKWHQTMGGISFRIIRKKKLVSVIVSAKHRETSSVIFTLYLFHKTRWGKEGCAACPCLSLTPEYHPQPRPDYFISFYGHVVS